MEFINQIRRFILLFILHRKTAVSKKQNPVNLEVAKQIGILFNAENIPQNDIIVSFAAKLKAL
ncbi:MAG: hypothetical protein KA174_00925, partial [Chitinophagales bacterium]|nr:hypothetical protein [Chitinophagales bacterium]